MNNNKKIIIGVVVILIAIALCIFCYFTFFNKESKKIKFEADIHVVSTEDGGPILDNYRTTLKTESLEIPVKIILGSKVDKVSPGDNASVTIELDEKCDIKVGDGFDLITSGENLEKTIATGTVTKNN